MLGRGHLLLPYTSGATMLDPLIGLPQQKIFCSLQLHTLARTTSSLFLRCNHG